MFLVATRAFDLIARMNVMKVAKSPPTLKKYSKSSEAGYSSVTFSSSA